MFIFRNSIDNLKASFQLSSILSMLSLVLSGLLVLIYAVSCFLLMVQYFCVDISDTYIYMLSKFQFLGLRREPTGAGHFAATRGVHHLEEQEEDGQTPVSIRALVSLVKDQKDRCWARPIYL